MKFNFRDNSTKKKKILIVEDEPMSVLLIQQILKSYQFELIVATNGFDAIEKFKNTEISLVIMDLGQYIEYKGEDFKLVARGNYNDYGYYEMVGEQTKLPLLVATP